MMKQIHFRTWKSGKHWLVAASVLAILAGGAVSPTPIHAAEAATATTQTTAKQTLPVHHVDYDSLTAAEKAAIVKTVPTAQVLEDTAHYKLVYQKTSTMLPTTGNATPTATSATKLPTTGENHHMSGLYAGVGLTLAVLGLAAASKSKKRTQLLFLVALMSAVGTAGVTAHAATEIAPRAR